MMHLIPMMILVMRTSAVVAAVLEAAQAVNEHLDDLAAALGHSVVQVGNDSTPASEI